MKKIIRWIPAIAVMVIIFLFSQQSGVDSKQLSVKVADGMFGILRRKVFIESYITPIRKCAHFLIYSLLGVSVMYALIGYKLKAFKMYGICAGICFLYAAFDEFHQMFVPDRGPMVTDVLIDSAGAFLGGAAVLAVYLKVMKRKRA